MGKEDTDAGHSLQTVEHATGQRAKVNVCSQVHPGCCYFLIRVTIFHDQRHPLRQLTRIFRVLHAMEQVILLESVKAFVKIAYIVFSPYKAHVRNRADEVWVRQKALLNQKRPELLR